MYFKNKLSISSLTLEMHVCVDSAPNAAYSYNHESFNYIGIGIWCFYVRLVNLYGYIESTLIVWEGVKPETFVHVSVCFCLFIVLSMRNKAEWLTRYKK